MLLCAVARGFGLAARPAIVGALAFLLTPYAAYVHGWVATIADLSWVSCGLLLALCALRWQRPAWIALAAFALALAAALGKEAAVSIPLLCVLAWGFDAARRPRWFAAAAGSGLAIALFLLARLPALLHAPRAGGERYVPALANAPLRWLEYQVFPPLVPLLEVEATFLRLVPAALAVLIWLALLSGLWQAGRRWLALFLIGGALALGPTLLLGASASQYAYGYSAFCAICLAAAWVHAPRSARWAMSAFIALALAHGVVVMARMRTVALAQARFSPALAQQLRARHGDLRLRLAPDAKPWIFARLTHEIPGYAGVPIGDRVRVVEGGDAADFIVLRDGSLAPSGSADSAR